MIKTTKERTPIMVNENDTDNVDIMAIPPPDSKKHYDLMDRLFPNLIFEKNGQLHAKISETGPIKNLRFRKTTGEEIIIQYDYYPTINNYNEVRQVIQRKDLPVPLGIIGAAVENCSSWRMVNIKTDLPAPPVPAPVYRIKPSDSHQSAGLIPHNIREFQEANWLREKKAIGEKSETEMTRAERRRLSKAEANLVGIRRKENGWFRMRQIEKMRAEGMSEEEISKKYEAAMNPKRTKKQNRKFRQPIMDNIVKLEDINGQGGGTNNNDQKTNDQ